MDARAREGATVVSPFGVEVSGPPATPVVVVRGEIDVATSPQLRNDLSALIGGGARHLTLDFAAVSFVDSSGLGVLVGTYKRLREDGGSHPHRRRAAFGAQGVRDHRSRSRSAPGLAAVGAAAPHGKRPSPFWFAPRSFISRSCSATSGSRS